MADIFTMPYKGAANLGRGVNILTGEFIGKALKVISKEDEVVGGGSVVYSVNVTETYDSLMESLDLSVGASGRYGMFSAEGRFGLSEKTEFNAQSTFVVASCKVRNAFIMADQVELLPEAKDLLAEPDKFKAAFGTGFVRGLQTGGEFYVVLQITCTDTKVQKSLAVDFQAEVNGLAAGGSFQMSLNTAKKTENQTTETTIIMYQQAGIDRELSIVKDTVEIFQRLKDFPTIARANPAGYECEVARYTTLALPQINEELVADRQMALSDCARLRLKYMTRRNDIQFARENPVYFVDLPADDVLADLADKYARAVAAVQLHAQKIAEKTIAPTIFVLSEVVPPLELPVVNLNRVNFKEEIPVPDLVNMSLESAIKQLQALHLKEDKNGVGVNEGTPDVVDTVLSQQPPPGTLVQPDSLVQLTYKFVSQQRFPWMKGPRGLDPHVLLPTG
jgi:hypothetical protein